MAGGTLVQDCNNHCVWHDIRTSDDRLIYVSSTHHQMMVPGPNAEVLAWAEPRRSKVYRGGPVGKTMPAPKVELDCAYYPEFRFLSMQFHPEYMQENSEAVAYSQQLIATKLELKPLAKRQHGQYFPPLPPSRSRRMSRLFKNTFFGVPSPPDLEEQVKTSQKGKA